MRKEAVFHDKHHIVSNVVVSMEMSIKVGANIKWQGMILC